MFLKGKYHNETIPADSDTHTRKDETSFLIVKLWYHILNKWDCIHWLLNLYFQIWNYRFAIINCWNTEEINIQNLIMHVCPTSSLDVLGLEHSILSGTTYVKHIRNKAIRLTNYIYIHTLYKTSKNWNELVGHTCIIKFWMLISSVFQQLIIAKR
jgi:hypothetical protein